MKVVSAVRELINRDLRDAPRKVGKPLQVPFAGQWVARRSTYRIRFRIADDSRTIYVLDIQGRSDAYRYSGGR